MRTRKVSYPDPGGRSVEGPPSSTDTSYARKFPSKPPMLIEKGETVEETIPRGGKNRIEI